MDNCYCELPYCVPLKDGGVDEPATCATNKQICEYPSQNNEIDCASHIVYPDAATCKREFGLLIMVTETRGTVIVYTSKVNRRQSLPVHRTLLWTKHRQYTGRS